MVDGKEVACNEDRAMNVVIVGASEHVSRIYYAGAYKKGVVSAPDCWSADGSKPDPKVENPQSKNCVDCPQNIKGSGQGESRACRFQQRIAVVLEGDINGPVYQLNVPAKSIFGEGENNKWPLQAYARRIATQGAPIMSVVTEMRFDTSGIGKITFKPVRLLENDEFDVALEKSESDEVKRLVTMSVNQTAKQIEHKEAPAKIEEPAESVEPKKVANKKEKEAPSKVDVEKVIDEWDDDEE